MKKVLNWEHFNPDERQILLFFMLITPPVSLDNLIDLAGASPVKVLKVLEGLNKKKTISVNNEQGTGFYQISDPSLIESLLKQIPEQKKRKNANQVIRYFDSHLKEGPKKSLLMTHLYYISGLKPDRVEWVLQAGEHCRSLNLMEDSARYYRMALNHLKGKRLSRIKKTNYIDAVLGLIQAHGHLIPHSEQKPFLKRALKFAEETRDLNHLVKIHLAYARVLRTTGKYKEASRLFDEGWELAQELGNEDLLKKAALWTTDFLFWQGRVADAIERYEKVIGNLEKFPTDQITLQACATLGWCYGINGQVARGIGLLEAVKTKARELSLSGTETYADIMIVMTLLEARLVREAEPYLSIVLNKPEEKLGHYILWAANSAAAFVRFHNGDLEGCFGHQKEAYKHSEEIGWPHHRGPWNFNYLDALEEQGMVVSQMNYESELRRIFNWPDIYMKGVAYRYRALRRIKGGYEKKEIYQDFDASINSLRSAGANMELSRTKIMLARLLLEDGEQEKAQRLLRQAWDVFSDVNEDLFPSDLKQFLDIEEQETLLVNTIIDVGNTIGTVREKTKLLERIINLSMRFTSAERGGVFLIEAGRMHLLASRNLDQEMVQAETFEHNLRIIEKVAQTGKGIIQGGYKDKNSYNMTRPTDGFMICSALTLQGQVKGVLYMDGRFVNRQLDDTSLPLLTAIGNQVAVALDNVRAYEEIADLRDRMTEETLFYRKEMERSPELQQIIGSSDKISYIRDQIQQVATADTTVLVTGETGVGKELVASAIHGLSPRADGPFIPVSIAALSKNLIESELFGHEKGAFTGASQIRRGRFELSDGGTLFLDDIEDLSLEIQAKLLRILQEREFERVGGTKTIRSDFRLIVSTNIDLKEMVKKRAFRSDLYYRLKVFPIIVPPLRERKEDIPELAAYFLDLYRTIMRKDVKRITNEGMNQLLDYSWPGNIRELRHVIERGVILSGGETLKLPNLKESHIREEGEGSYKTLLEMEKSYIIDVLEECDWIVSGPSGAAGILGLKPTTLYSKMKRIGIKKKLSYGDR